MRVLSFRVRNYKSIKDSGICYLAEGITILAGKNESGKTSLLEALEDFSVGRSIRQEAIPIHDESAIPQIAVTFAVDEQTLEEIIGRPALGHEKKSVEVEVTKTYPNEFSVHLSAPKKLGLVDDAPEAASTDESPADASAMSLAQFNDALLQKLPNFILFSSFEDVFPSEIPLTVAASHPLIQDLDAISNLRLDLIQSGTSPQKKKHKRQLNLQVNEEYKKYWTQDDTNLEIDWDSSNLQFFVEEDGEFYPPDRRSKGKQWHLAFYVRVTARSKDDVDNVILIDEPGLFLHATAQRDILEKLEASAKDVQVMFTTHSPYLLEADKLDRIRLVTRTAAKGTRIENMIHKVADKEALTPILTAIGLEAACGIADVNKLKNVVVEGPSDWYYLQALSEIVGQSGVNFVFGGGAGNMPIVGTILAGWGCHVLYLYDNDKGKRDAVRAIKKSWLISDDAILTPTDNAGDAIEDLFSPDDFKAFVLKDSSKSYSGANSEYVKKSGLNKVMLAREFMRASRLAKPKLDAATTQAVEKLMKRFQSAFDKEYPAS
jgi:AAA15 family ATPase/GTPase